MAKLARDLATPSGGGATLNPRETIFGTGTLGAVNAEVVIPVDGCSTVSLDMRGTFSATVGLEGSVDGTNWVSIPARPVNIASIAYALGFTAAGAYVAKCAAYRLVRARCTAFTSGSVTATVVAQNGLLDDSLQGMVTPTLSTTVGTAGTATTLTIASPGAGLRHYLTYLSINRFATALLTAAAAPVTVTTTNLPGSLAFSFPAEAAAQGTIDRWREDFAYPLATSAQATATTIVCPATTGVIWRVTAGYYVAP